MQYPGAIYHVYDRGDRREAIFLTNDDRMIFLETLAETCERTGFLIHCYALMKNHYHLELETPEPNLVEGMKWFQGTYTQRFNRRHGLVGHLYQGRYKAKPIQADSPEYFRRVADYIHLNPARAGLLDRARPDLQQYPWSSFCYIIGRRRHLASWLTPRRVLASLGCQDDVHGRRAFRGYLNGRAREIMSTQLDPKWKEEWSQLQQGWYAGSKEFGDWLLERVEEVVTPHKRESYCGPELVRHDQTCAEQLLDRGLKALGIILEDVQPLAHNDRRKQGLAWLIKSHTMVRDLWIVERLTMGHRSNVSRAVSAFRNPRSQQLKRLKHTLHKCTD